MRKFIIDTDTASDDAAALMIAALSPDIEILGVTVLGGNVPLRQAGRNAKMTLELCGCDAPVLLGQDRPMFHEREATICIHGEDGMGDCDLIHPKEEPRDKSAVSFILNMVKKYPDEVEIVVLGPATNIALAVLLDREAMSHVKHIWTMGTPGFGVGNATPVAEFNVFIDPEAYSLMLQAGVPTTIAGFDITQGDIVLDERELAACAAGNEVGQFLVKATRKLVDFNVATRGKVQADLCDALAVAAAVWPDYVLKTVPVACSCVDTPGETYGQVIFYEKGRTYETQPVIDNYNAEVITKVDEDLFTRNFLAMMGAEMPERDA